MSLSLYFFFFVCADSISGLSQWVKDLALPQAAV